MDTKTKRPPSGDWQLPRSKREVVIEGTRLASKAEFEVMNKSDLIVQYRIREKLLQQMVGTLYPSIVASEMLRIEKLVGERIDNE